MSTTSTQPTATPAATHQPALLQRVQATIDRMPVWDLHTHLYSPRFGTPLAGAGNAADPAGLMLWGIDELLTYHYLVAEVFRVVPARKLPYDDFWKMSAGEQADHIWRHLFRERSPLSEACRGVLTTLARLGLDPNEPNLDGYRRWFAEQDPDRHIDRVMQLAGVVRITMTNDVFDDNERQRWLADPTLADDDRFAPVLRFDPLLCDWPAAAKALAQWGYKVTSEPNTQSLAEVRRFLDDWIARTRAIYAAVSLPPGFDYHGPDDQRAESIVLRQAVLPALEQHNLALAMMIGVTRGVNRGLQAAGDTVGLARLDPVVQLCAEFPQNRFLVTMLARENQHQLAVTARKFDNLMPFGCWWFVNNPSLIEEITRMRMELLGTSFIPQHSDARVLEQIVYKWDHSKQIIARVLADKYADVAATGWPIRDEAIERDLRLLLHDNFASFVRGE